MVWSGSSPPECCAICREAFWKGRRSIVVASSKGRSHGRSYGKSRNSWTSSMSCRSYVDNFQETIMDFHCFLYVCWAEGYDAFWWFCDALSTYFPVLQWCWTVLRGWAWMVESSINWCNGELLNWIRVAILGIPKTFRQAHNTYIYIYLSWAYVVLRDSLIHLPWHTFSGFEKPKKLKLF